MGCSCPLLLIVRVFQLVFSLLVLAATADMIKKFADAREIHDAIDTVSQLRPLIDHLLLVTPHRIYLGLSVSVWTTLATLYIIFIPRWRNAKLAPRAAILTLEIFTTIFWFCALIGLWLFTVEIEPLCMVADATRVKKFIGACVIMKTATAAAALSWFLWFCTWITVSIQACRSRRNKSKAPPPTIGLVNGNQGNWPPLPYDMSKAEQGVVVNTVEMLPRQH